MGLSLGIFLSRSDANVLWSAQPAIRPDKCSWGIVAGRGMLYRTAEIALDALSSDHTFQAVYDYWHELRGARVMPSWSDVDMMALPLEVVPWCSVIDVVEGGRDFVVRFWGTERVRLQAMDYTGRSVTDFQPPAVSRKVWEELSQVVEAGAPMLFETWLGDKDISPRP